jgi:stage III sporulation protein SpoIIIAA
VKVERVSWLWQDRIPLGKLTVLEGHPGTGKSTFTIELAACVTTGTALLDGPQLPPADVLILTAEDGLADTVRPRLEAAKGDATRVHVVDGIVTDDGGLDFPGLPDDLALRGTQVLRARSYHCT